MQDNKRLGLHSLMVLLMLSTWQLPCPGGFTRNTARDHLLPPFVQPRIDLSRYKSVQDRPGQNSDLALAVAVSGGGHRAANFATGVLLALEESGTNETVSILDEVDYFSTVSGGGFAIAAYLSAQHDYLQEHAEESGSKNDFSFRAALAENDGALLKNLRRDYQITLLEAAITPECIGFYDAGDLLESKFDKYLLGAEKRGRSLTLGDIFPARHSPDPVQLPYWVMNATVYENGARFFFTPDILERFRVQSCVHRMSSFELGEHPSRLPLAVGLKASASFPVLIPATTVGCAPGKDELNEYLHLVDGGLVDNLGIYTAFDLLRQDSASHKVLLVIDAYKGIQQPYSRWRASPHGAGMAVRIMKISLDSQNNRFERILAQLNGGLTNAGGSADVKALLFSFDELRPEFIERLDNLDKEAAHAWQDNAKGFARRLGRELTTLLQDTPLSIEAPGSDSALYEDARAIGTSLFITQAQQELLLEAGSAVVREKSESLLQLLEGNEPAAGTEN